MMVRHSMLLAIIAILSVGTPTYGNYSRTIQLNDLDNRAVVEDNGNPDDNIIQIRSTNESFSTIEFEQPTDELIIQMGQGTDSVTFEVSIEANVFVQSGSASVRGFGSVLNRNHEH